MEQIYSISDCTTFFDSGCNIFYGSHAASDLLLGFAAEISVERPLHLLDFGNRCDMYFIARRLRYLTRDPAAAMLKIRLQRAFTCYQSLALLRQLGDMEMDTPVIILDLLAPFLDENIKSAEIYRLFAESLNYLRNTSKERILLAGVKPVPQKLAPDRVCLLNNLARTFGLIPVQNPEYKITERSPGYLDRPAVRTFLSGDGSLRKPEKTNLMAGQPSLFDLI